MVDAELVWSSAEFCFAHAMRNPKTYANVHDAADYERLECHLVLGILEERRFQDE